MFHDQPGKYGQELWLLQHTRLRSQDALAIRQKKVGIYFHEFWSQGERVPEQKELEFLHFWSTLMKQIYDTEHTFLLGTGTFSDCLVKLSKEMEHRT